MLSDLVGSLFCICLASIVFMCFVILSRKRKNYPPGPARIPILGNLLSVGQAMHLSFQRYHRIFGPIFSVRLGTEEAIVLHGAKLIKEAFNHPAFSGRPDREGGEFIAGGKDGITLAAGRIWSDHRRFTLRNLRDFGFGKTSLEGLIMDEVQELVGWIQEQNGKPIELRRRFSLAVVNALWTLLCGKRYAHDDPKLLAILDQMEAMLQAVLGGKGTALLVMFYPRIAKMFPNLSGWNFLLKTKEPREKYFRQTIKEHEQTLPEGSPRDFIDIYLQEAKKTTDPDSIFHKNTAEDALLSLLSGLFLAGSDTTSTTLNWAILYLLHYPDIQTKLQHELDAVVGKSRFPSLTDRNSLPFTEAFIMELMRMTSILPYGVPHTVTENVEFHGYFIPNGTAIYASLYSTHHDPDVWGDPENFRPERFLSMDGTRAERHESLIPFSVGKRSCLGEVLARDQLFLFTTTLVQRFNIVQESGRAKPTLEVRLGQITLEPQHFHVVMKDRMI